MFNPKVSVLKISKKNFILYTVEGRKNVKELKKGSWDEKNLLNTLKTIHATYGLKSTYILLDQDMAYDIRISLARKECADNIVTCIHSEASKSIPEHFDDSQISYLVTSQNEKDLEVAACVPVLKEYLFIQKSLEQLGIEIKGTQSVLLATQSNQNPVIGVTGHTVQNISHFNYKKVIVLGILSIAAVLVLFVSMALVQSMKQDKKPKIVPLVSPTVPKETTTKFDPSLYKIEILNGSTIAGEAGRLKKILEEKGYRDIQTGNTSSPDLGQSILKVTSASGSAQLIQSIQDILIDYKFDVQETLPEDSAFQLQIILGTT